MKNTIIENRMHELNNMQILSFDAETNGLWGQAFSIAAVVCNPQGNEIDRFLGRCPIQEEVNPWVAENVLPQMGDIEETHDNYEALLKDFFEFAQKYYKDNTKVLSHMGHIVEAKLLQDAHRFGIIGDWDAPYEWLDVCLLFGDSVDSYNKANGIEVTGFVGGTHNPLYDCISSYRAFKHFVSEEKEEELPIAILNTTILTADGDFTLSSISLDEAKSLIEGKETLSAVGHESTAEILTEMLGREVAMNRIQFIQQPGQKALCFKLSGRPKEGAILSKEEVLAMNYEFKLLERRAK